MTTLPDQSSSLQDNTLSQVSNNNNTTNISNVEILKVTTAQDEADGSASSGSGLSLRDAILIANANQDTQYVIELDAETTYELTLQDEVFEEEEAAVGDLDIVAGSNFTIRGNGPNSVIDANGLSRVFEVREGAALILDDVTVTGGYSSRVSDIASTDEEDTLGGGIYNNGVLTIKNSSILENSTQRGNGGGIFNSENGDLTIENSQITGNSVDDDPDNLAGVLSRGGGIYNGGFYNREQGSLKIFDTLISENISGGGGGIQNDGETFIQNSSIIDNQALSTGGGGGINHNSISPLIVEDSLIRGNSAESWEGGGIYVSSGRATIIGSEISSNKALFNGGGVSTRSASGISIQSSHIHSNEAGSGGGIRALFSNLEIVNSLISNNHAGNDFTGRGGGISFTQEGTGDTKRTFLLSGSTVSGNTAESEGGGVFLNRLISDAEAHVITNSTIVDNAILGENEDTLIPLGDGVLYLGSSGLGPVLTLSNTIIANDGSEGDISRGFQVEGNFATGIVSEGVNLVKDGFLKGDNVINADPNLSPLQDNGGLTLSHIPLAGSPVIDAGGNDSISQDILDLDGDSNTTELVPFDQRGPGFNRIVNGQVDLGAVEFGTGTPPPSNQAPELTSPSTFSIAENTTSIADIQSTDDSNAEGNGLVYSLTGGADRSLFSITSDTGLLSFINAPDFENPSDANSDNSYDVEIAVTDTNGATDSQLLSVQVTDVDETVPPNNQAPTLTSPSTFTVTENTTSVGDLQATDDNNSEGNGLTYSLTGGADQALFNITSDTGLLTFINAPDFETPGDVNSDNSYDVEVTVTDANGATDSQLLSVQVTDVAEPPAPPATGEIRGLAWNDLNGDGVKNTDSQTGKIVVSHDEWAISDRVFGLSPNAATFSQNIATYFTGGEAGKFYGDYSNDFSLTLNELSNALQDAGHTWTTSDLAVIPNLSILSQFDGVFLAGSANIDTNVLVDYVNAGGNVYLGGGTGFQEEASFWNSFLNEFGLSFEDSYNNIIGNKTVDSSHPIFDGVSNQFHAIGNSIIDLEPDNPDNQIVQTLSDQGVNAVYSSSDTIEPGLAGVSIYLDTNNNGLLDSTEPVQVTAADDPNTPDIDETGQYAFSNLAPGTYVVREIVPDGFEQTFPGTTGNNLIANGSFEEGPNPGRRFLRYRAESIEIPNWRVTQESVDLTGTVYRASDGSASLDLDGAVGDAGGIEQTFETTVGEQYLVSFDLAGNPGFGPQIKELKVDVAGVSEEFEYDITGQSLDLLEYIPQSFEFIATEAETTLQFTSLTGSGWGPNIDNVSVVEVSSGNGSHTVTIGADGNIVDNINFGNKPLSTTPTAPILTSPSTFSVFENVTFVGDIQATDDTDTEGNGLAYSLTGGTDQASFTIAPDTGVINFISAPDFESPGDANGDNSYEVEVSVTDSTGLSDAQLLNIQIQDITEQPPIPPSPVTLIGTDGRDTLTGTEKDEIIIGKGSSDELIGNGGRDQFVFESLDDRIDRIRDFEVGSDKIILTGLFAELGVDISGYEQASAEGYINMISFGRNDEDTRLRIDPDGATGRRSARTLAYVYDVSVAELSTADNFAI